MRKLIPLLLALSIVCACWPGIFGIQAQAQAATASASGGQASLTPSLYLDGNPLNSDVPPVVSSNRTLVPVSFVANGLGYRAKYSAADRTVEVTGNNMKILFALNDTRAWVNDEPVTVDVPVTIMQGRTMVPLRFVGEKMNLEVYWDEQSKSVHMYRKPEPKPPVVLPEPAEPGQGGGESGLPNPADLLEARPVPLDATALIQSIQLDAEGNVLIAHEGVIEARPTFELPAEGAQLHRIVLDLPLTGLSPAFVEGFTLQPGGARSAQGVLLAANHPSLAQVRYSPANSPAAVRVVLDMNIPAPHTVTQSEGLIRIALGAPDPNLAPLTDAAGNKIFKVVLDAGHGGRDPGAISVNKRTEKEFNLAIALKMQALLVNEPRIKVFMTRESDTYPTLDERAEFANRLHADLFLSIHANAINNPSVRGTETFFHSDQSRAFANIVHEHLLKATGFPDRKVKNASFLVIRKTNMPAVLIEAGFLTNAADEEALFTEAVQNRIAQELVTAIKKHLKLA